MSAVALPSKTGQSYPRRDRRARRDSLAHPRCGPRTAACSTSVLFALFRADTEESRLLPRFDRDLLSTYLRPEWPRVLLLGLLLFAGIGLQLANPQIVRAFIDRAQAGEPLEQLVWRTTNALRADLTRHVLDLDNSFHAQHNPGDLIERIDGDVSAIADFFSRFVLQVLGSGVFLLGVLVLLFLEDWRIGALLSAFALAALLFMMRGGGFVAVRAAAARQAAADLSGYLEERLAGL